MSVARWLAAALLLAGCSEYRVNDEERPPADPPGDDGDVHGDPPDWNDCPNGLLGRYHNLSAEHAYVTEGRDGAELAELFTDDTFAFERYDPSLEWGANWWPVDDGIAGDPEGFAVRWVGWIRGWSDGNVEIVLGATDDAEVRVDGEVVADVTASQTLLPELHAFYLDGGVYPFEVTYAHRRDASGMRFRVVGGDVSICIPSYSEAVEE
ncbi:MAG: hypothetical protein KC912_07000 [Proteobacteria bacterium]|nr:hypothetical protein [Pseudomonadota bacterium]